MSTQSWLCLSGLLNAPGSQTASAERNVAPGSIDDNMMTRDVELLAALADIVRMADLTADSRTSSAELTLAGMGDRHCSTSDGW
jgi:hypothetical protein